MRIIFCIVILWIGMVLSIPIGGEPALRRSVVVSQPDGSTLCVVRTGNAHCNDVFTEDGYLLQYDETLGYVYAEVDRDGSLTASGVVAHDAHCRKVDEMEYLKGYDADAISEALAYKYQEYERGLTVSGATRGMGLYSDAFPRKGEQKGLVILAEFQDVKFNSKNREDSKVDTYSYFHDMLNKPGFDMFGSNGSARDWFVENSGGIFIPTFDVFGPIELSNTMEYYGSNNAAGMDRRGADMVIEACKMLDAEIDFSEYDRDGDGYVDNVYIFYAGLGEADSNESDSLWPCNWTLTQAGKRPFTLDGVRIDRFAYSNETYDDLRRPDGIGTFVHEFSHVLGLPDLYPTATYSSKRDTPLTPWEYSVMDYGSYNDNGLTPPNYSAYERYALDWLVPSEIEEGENEIENIEESNRAIILRTSKDSEYYLLENRQLKGWDKALPAAGMLAWHVDYVPLVFSGNKVNNDKQHQHVELVKANGATDGRHNTLQYLKGFPFPGSSNTVSFGYATIPSLRQWDGASLGVELSGIRIEDGIVRFSAEISESSGITSIDADDHDMETGAAEVEVYDLSGRRWQMKDISSVPGLYIIREGSSVRKIVITMK